MQEKVPHSRIERLSEDQAETTILGGTEMHCTLNDRIAQVTDETLVVGIGIGSEGNDNFTQKSQQPAKLFPTGMTQSRSIVGTRAMGKAERRQWGLALRDDPGGYGRCAAVVGRGYGLTANKDVCVR